MPNKVDSIVDVTITTESGAVAVQSFGVPCIINPSGEAVGDAGFFRSKSYGSLLEVAVDFVAGTPVYKFAEGLFSAEAPVKEMIVGQTATDDANIEASALAIVEDASGFYCFGTVNRDLTEAKDLADWCEASGFLFIFAEDADGDLGGTTDGLGKYVFDSGLKRTGVFYHEDATTGNVEGAFIGSFITLPIGSYTVKFKDVVGLVPSNLTTAEQVESRALKVNTFVDKGGFRLIQEGTTGASFIDEIISDDWVKARITEKLLSLFKKKDIVPYDDEGIELVSNAIREVLDDGIARGVVTDHDFNEDGDRTGGYTVTSPKSSAIPSETKETRVYSETTFTYHKRVAMHKAVINGVALY